ncbi:MAG: gfo/Idh/MocA family oxidoreductase, partial [Oscillospiraceae bacterium]|nr:gfo/Idh/MocA family oxidoreductase [Oscillospiraceae bacterium]
MGSNPESFDSFVRMNEFGTDEFSALQLVYPGGKTAQSVQTIGMQIERRAALFFDEAAIYIPDFQGAYKMTVRPNCGEEFSIECRPEINGFEYEIREATNCVKEGRTHSKIHSPEQSVALMRLMDDVRRKWGMRFSYE